MCLLGSLTGFAGFLVMVRSVNVVVFKYSLVDKC